MTDIVKLEQELLKLTKQDKQTWVQFYKLIKKVEEEELWREAEKKSFTQWIKDFSVKSKVHESVIWNRLKAGKVYATYERVQARKGVAVPPIDEVDVTVDSLILLDKITKKSEQIGAELVDKVLNKELSRQELRDTYKALGGDPRKAKKLHEEEKAQLPSPEERLTAAAIVSALATPGWLGDYEAKRKPFKTSFEQDKYRTYTEFPVYTGTSKKSRRIDILAVENLTNDDFGVNLHGVEIKVSKPDLLNDTKYMEYSNSVDFLWLAIPCELLEVALETKANTVGIIVVGADNNATIHTQASRLDPLAREETLTNIILKTI